MKNMTLIRSLLLASVALFSVQVSAHTDEYLDTIAGTHGGQLRMAGPAHFELVVQPTRLQVYVTDHAGTPTSVQGATGTAVVLAGKSKQNITLTPKGDNVLEGSGTFDPTQPIKAVVTITQSGKEPLQARFDTSKLKQPAKEPAHSHTH